MTFPAIEERMARARQGRRAVRAQEVPVALARERFAAEGQRYKVELIDDLVARHEAPLETVSLYTNGPFTDLCRGPARAEHRKRSAPSSCSRSPAPTGAATRSGRC